MKPRPPVIITAAAAVELAVVRRSRRGAVTASATRAVRVPSGRIRNSTGALWLLPPSTTSANHSRSTSTPVLKMRGKLKNCDLPKRAVIVMHRHFDDAEAGVLDLLHHLEADDAAVLLEVDALEDRRAASAGSRSRRRARAARTGADDVVIDAADDDAVQRIGAADLVAVHQVGVGGQRVPQQRQLARIVLRVAVGVEDQLLGRRRKPVCSAPP